MRKVVNTSEVPHLWAHQTQDEARNSAKNLYFLGKTIYSYRDSFALASIFPFGILVNQDTYSNTTAGHKSDVRRALPMNVENFPITSLSRGTVDNIEASKGTKVPPQIIVDLRQKVGGLLTEVSKFRVFWKVRANVSEASDYEKTALALFKYAGFTDKQAEKLWGLPLTSTIDLDEENFQAQKKVIEGNYTQRLSMQSFTGLKEEFMRRLESFEASVKSADGWQVQNFKGQMNSLYGSQKSAIDQMKFCGASWRGAKDVFDRFKTACETAEKAIKNYYRVEQARCYERAVFSYYMYRHLQKHGKSEALKGELRPYLPRDLWNYMGPAADGFLKDDQSKPHLEVLQKIYRTLEWQKERSKFDSAAVYLEELRGLNVEECPDSVRRAIHCVKIPDQDGSPFARAFGAQLRVMSAQLEFHTRQYESYVAQTYAEGIADWQAGGKTIPLRSWPTLARINLEKGVVETTLGANVPLAHAVRLGRIVTKYLQGGKRQEWERGNGPKVGHFFLDMLEPTGQATIGCHVFSDKEAHRMLDLLSKVVLPEEMNGEIEA